MHVLVHDFAGHPFAAQLSRRLATENSVGHAYCGGVTTGRGALQRTEDDPRVLRFIDVSDKPFERYAPIGRLRSEISYGRRVARLVHQDRPEVVLSANCPLVAQARLWRAADRVGARKVYWLQDFLGRGTRSVLHDKHWLLGRSAGAAWERLEEHLLRRADHIVAITEDFVPALQARGVSTPVTVIANWTPLDEVPQRPKRTAWSEAAGWVDRPVALYAGTLGHKHDPEHLVAAAREVGPAGGIVAVATEGLGREYLEQRRRELALDNLWLRDFVPWEQVPDMLGAADVLLVLLEAEAGGFSVPSKVLTYLAAGRPIVGAMPAENLATKTIAQAGAGHVVTPGDHAAFATAVSSLLDDPPQARCLGDAGRSYAEKWFDIDTITERFEAVLATPAG
jgi:colanic acid biosynthesis glycosyl transferase WcaI